VGMIKRAQRSFGRVFTVSGVIAAFRKSAVHQVGYWSADMLTEDIDITWKLQRAGWDVRFEPNALTWILMPETLKGLWKQRLRWAMGGAQVLLKNLDVLRHPGQSFLWPLLVEMCVSVFWCYSMLLLTVMWVQGLFFPLAALPVIASPLSPQGSGLTLGTTCLLQFAFSKWLDSRYDRGLGRNLFWMIWYPFAFWIINSASMVVAYPKVLLRRQGKRARWISPDRGIRP
jgi:poly-beta-1,6-N-acetyl-D-glucosamine synthase